ncbi:hypothetical protein BDZ45DRAFT_737143 [Acephala macrosclerotiorum]|nr:hypothetical protein BDZ45DRAFT_737143 [Acephala macrosclerotiorum]
MDYEQGQDPFVDEKNIESAGTMEELRMLNSARELLFVVAKPARMISPSGLIFIEPTQCLHDMITDMELGDSMFTLSRQPSRPETTSLWDEAECRLEKILEQLKKKRTEDRKRDREENIFNEDETNERDDHANLTNFKVPKVRFVEAIERGGITAGCCLIKPWNNAM